MPWVRFVADFPWKPVPQQTVMYRAGMVLLVTTACAAAARAKGAALPIAKGADGDGGR